MNKPMTILTSRIANEKAKAAKKTNTAVYEGEIFTAPAKANPNSAYVALNGVMMAVK